MPSHLRLQSSFGGPVSANATIKTSPPPAKKQKRMALTQVYYVASTARSKLGSEASKADHNLRRLVGHANLLDNLMIELADAEREASMWLDESIRTASKPEEPRRVQWIDTIAEEDEDSESDEESDTEDAEMFNIPVRRLRQPPVIVSSDELEHDDGMEFDDDFEDEDLALHRTPSHSPPELTHDSDSDDEEEEVPASPEDIQLQLSEKERAAIATTAFYDVKAQQGLEDYVMQQPQQPFIAAC